MFLLSCKKKKKIKINTHIHNITLTHVCLHLCAHMAPSSKRNTTTHTGCLHTLLCHTRSLQIHTRLRVAQLKDQHHLEVKTRYCLCLADMVKLLFVSCLCKSIEKCFPAAGFLALTIIASLKPFIEKKGGICGHERAAPWVMRRA